MSHMATATALDLLQRGYAYLVSVIPPHGRISPTSKIKPESAGKVPGIQTSRGDWVGYDWRSAPPATRADVMTWMGAGANVGIRTDYFPAVDIDCTDPALAGVIRHQAIMYLGLAPERIGREPKSLLLYRTEEPFGRMRLWIGEDQLVEILGDGQQFVALGTHPGTRRPYRWPQGLIPAEDLTLISREDAEAFLEALAADADMLGYEVRREGSGALSMDRTAIDQTALRGDADLVKKALSLIPNNNDVFPGRDDYLRMGYAIKAALGEDGYELFYDWASKWEGNERVAGNAPEEIESDWQRMKPPFEVGADYIYETAKRFGYNQGADEFVATEEASEEPDKPSGPIFFSDAHLANIIVQKYSHRLRYCPERGCWLAWDGRRWKEDSSGEASYLAGLLCQTMSHMALDIIANPVKAEATATRLASTATRNAVLNYAQSYPAMQVPQSQLDFDPYLLNTPGGVVDLRTGKLRASDPAQYMTRITSTAPDFDMPTPLWDAFLDECTASDRQLQLYLQRLIGYALTGLKTEHNLAFLYGSGGNGKGVFLNTIAGILDEYAKAASMDTFTAAKFDRHPTDMASLAGARLVTAQETQEGRSWDEQKVKMLTSTDKVQARFMREDFFEFVPTFKLVFAGNHKPEIRNLDDAMRRRFHLVPFTIKPKKVNSLLQDQLKDEWPGILAWAIRGSRMWLDKGLAPPPSVIDATQEYFDEEDPIGQWIKDRVVFDDASTEMVPFQNIYDNFNEWCGENGERVKSPKAFSRALVDRGRFRRERNKHARGFSGFLLRGGPGSEFSTES